MSFLAKISKKILKLTKPNYMTSQKDIEIFLNNKLTKKDEKIKTLKNISYYHNNKVIEFGDKNKSDYTILYIHGGGFVNELNLQHQLYSYILSKKLNAYVIVPIYPLSPKHTYKETYNLISEIYTNLIKEQEKIILLGDSAGGGFILSFCQYLKTVNIKQPLEIIVFSPWLDLSMSISEYNEYETKDVVLGEIGLKEIGKRWAGDLDTRNYKVSPYFGDNSDLAKILIFTATDEIFYPDIKKYYMKLKKANVDIKLIKEEGLFHVYPLYPIPEAKKCLNYIKEELSTLK